MDDYEIKIWLAAMDLDVSDVEELFHLLDDGGDAWMMVDGPLMGSMVQGQGGPFLLTSYMGYVYYINLYNRYIPASSKGVLFGSKRWCMGTPYSPFSTLWKIQVLIRAYKYILHTCLGYIPMTEPFKKINK